VVPTGTDPTFKSLVDAGALAEAMPGETTAEARKIKDPATQDVSLCTGK